MKKEVLFTASVDIDDGRAVLLWTKKRSTKMLQLYLDEDQTLIKSWTDWGVARVEHIPWADGVKVQEAFKWIKV